MEEEDSFRVRSEKAFGSLSSSSSNSVSSSLWKLEEGFSFITNQSNVNVSSHNKPMEKPPEDDDDIEDLSSDYEVTPSASCQLMKPEDQDEEEWDIRSSIGLVSTLDYEEEEDEYDKVAVGGEKDGDRLYISSITDCGTDVASHDELPYTFKDSTRDPRANRMAAISRLKEDAEAAGKFDCLRVSDNTLQPVGHTQNDTLEDGGSLKSVMKRKENQLDPKLQKRVRFEPGSRVLCEEESEGAKDKAMENFSVQEAMMSDEASLVTQDSSGVPDHVLNPSRYIHYTFDSSTTDIDEESNEKACMDFLNLIKRSSTLEPQPDEPSFVLPKSITFNPRKKPAGDKFTTENANEVDQNQIGLCKRSWPISTIEVVEESEVCAMEEDVPETIVDKSSSNSRRPGRHYRTKAKIDLDEQIT